jgi:hypothetical protein
MRQRIVRQNSKRSAFEGGAREQVLFRKGAPARNGRGSGETCGAWKPKVAVPFLEKPVLESGAFLYSKANEAMQVHSAAAAAEMHTTPEISDCFLNRFEWKRLRLFRAMLIAALVIGICAFSAYGQQKQNDSKTLELSRAVRPWEFLPVTGMRAGLLGDESGRMEAWVYPLKILREFHLKFHTEGRTIPGEALARTITVRPESSTILYAGDTFKVRETFFVPVHEQGAVILLDVETEQPFEIEAVFHRDFQLEWPAALGATYSNWEAEQHVFYFGEEQRKFAALVGSPTAAEPQQEYQTNYSEARESSFRLGATAKGKERKLLVIGRASSGGENLSSPDSGLRGFGEGVRSVLPTLSGADGQPGFAG